MTDGEKSTIEAIASLVHPNYHSCGLTRDRTNPNSRTN